MFGIDLSIVEDAKLDRIELEFLRHLIDCNLKRHHAGCLAGRAHGVAFGQIEHREPHCGHAILPGIKQPGLTNRRLGIAARQIARPSFMTDRGDLAVFGGADADALDRRRPVRGVVDDQRPRQRHFHRPVRRPRAKRREQRVGAQKQFAAEAAADERRHETNLVLGDSQRLGHVGSAPVDHLVRRPQRELVAVPGRDRSGWLHHRVRLVRCRVRGIELDGCFGKRAGKIACGRVGRSAKTRLVLDRGVLRAREIERASGLRIGYPNQRGGGARLFERLGNDERDCLVIMLNLRAAEQVGDIVVALIELAGVVRRHDRQHAGRGLGGLQIDGRDAALGDGRADHIAVGLIGDDVVPLVGIRRGAGGFQRTVDAIGRKTDHLELVDRVERGGVFEFHGFSLSLRRAPRRACAR